MVWTSTRWSRDDEAILVHTLALEKTRGGWRGKVPNKAAWIACVAALAGSEERSGGASKNILTIQSRWQRLKREFKIVKDIRNQPGWPWNNEKHITNVSLAAWKDYVAKHPEAKPYCRKPFPLYDKIAELIDGAHTVGNDSPHELTTVSSAASTGPSSIPEGPHENEEMMSGDDRDGLADIADERTQWDVCDSNDYISSSDEGSIDARSSRKRSFSEDDEHSNSRRISVGEEPNELANNIKYFADMVASAISQSVSTLGSTSSGHAGLEVRVMVISTIAGEERLTNAELSDAIMVIMLNPRIAEIYLALQRPGSRTTFIQRRIEEYRKSK